MEEQTVDERRYTYEPRKIRKPKGSQVVYYIEQDNNN